MSWAVVLGIAVGLAMDAFAVSIAAGLTIQNLTRRHVFRLAFHFGLFQALMPIMGWLAGTTIAEYTKAYDHWVAMGLLGAIGGKMLWESFRGEEWTDRPDPTRGWSLVTLSIATSIDALAAGLVLAANRVSVWAPAVVIGIVTGGLTAIGIRFGSRLGPKLGRWTERLGGIVLIAIGVKILIEHLFYVG